MKITHAIKQQIKSRWLWRHILTYDTTRDAPSIVEVNAFYDLDLTWIWPWFDIAAYQPLMNTAVSQTGRSLWRYLPTAWVISPSPWRTSPCAPWEWVTLTLSWRLMAAPCQSATGPWGKVLLSTGSKYCGISWFKMIATGRYFCDRNNVL